MKIEELIARIRKKEKPERAEEIIDLIKRKGAGYADYAMGYYDDIHMKYDSVMYDNMFLGVRLVKKDGMYGVTDNNGNEIIPCKFKKYSDIYDEWGEMGFPKTPVVMTEERLAAQQFKDGLNRKHDEEVASNNIKSISFFNERTVTGTELVKMSDGSIGIVGALAFSSNNIEVKNADGEHVMFLSGPELFKDGETPGAVICSDENNLYVATYNTEYSYIACYKIGDFEKVWKTPMYGSQIQSITVNDDEVIAFDMHDGKIKYFDKQSGKRNKDKEISTEKDIGPFNVKSHHNLASTNERLLAGVPGLTFGLLNFENELKVFDNDNGAVLSQKSVSQLIGTLNSLAIDQQKNRIFIAFDNKIAVFGDNGEYEGYFLAPSKRVHQLNFDRETGCLMISMTNKEEKGCVEVYKPEAITSLLKTSRELKAALETQILNKDTGLLQISEPSQELPDENQTKHVK